VPSARTLHFRRVSRLENEAVHGGSPCLELTNGMLVVFAGGVPIRDRQGTLIVATIVVPCGSGEPDAATRGRFHGTSGTHAGPGA
jgi:uncharacterized protein GlcG (DUF336 family)